MVLWFYGFHCLMFVKYKGISRIHMTHITIFDFEPILTYLKKFECMYLFEYIKIFVSYCMIDEVNM